MITLLDSVNEAESSAPPQETAMTPIVQLIHVVPHMTPVLTPRLRVAPQQCAEETFPGQGASHEHGEFVGFTQ